MNEPEPINLNELLSELDKYRGQVSPKVTITPEQKGFIIKCRDHPEPVSFTIMAELWQKLGWGNMNRNRLEDRYKKIKRGEL